MGGRLLHLILECKVRVWLRWRSKKKSHVWKRDGKGVVRVCILKRDEKWARVILGTRAFRWFMSKRLCGLRNLVGAGILGVMHLIPFWIFTGRRAEDAGDKVRFVRT